MLWRFEIKDKFRRPYKQWVLAADIQIYELPGRVRDINDIESVTEPAEGEISKVRIAFSHTWNDSPSMMTRSNKPRLPRSAKHETTILWWTHRWYSCLWRSSYTLSTSWRMTDTSKVVQLRDAREHEHRSATSYMTLWDLRIISNEFL